MKNFTLPYDKTQCELIYGFLQLSDNYSNFCEIFRKKIISLSEKRGVSEEDARNIVLMRIASEPEEPYWNLRMYKIWVEWGDIFSKSFCYDEWWRRREAEALKLEEHAVDAVSCYLSFISNNHYKYNQIRDHINTILVIRQDPKELWESSTSNDLASFAQLKILGTVIKERFEKYVVHEDVGSDEETNKKWKDFYTERPKDKAHRCSYLIQADIKYADYLLRQGYDLEKIRESIRKESKDLGSRFKMFCRGNNEDNSEGDNLYIDGAIDNYFGYVINMIKVIRYTSYLFNPDTFEQESSLLIDKYGRNSHSIDTLKVCLEVFRRKKKDKQKLVNIIKQIGTIVDKDIILKADNQKIDGLKKNDIKSVLDKYTRYMRWAKNIIWNIEQGSFPGHFDHSTSWNV